MSPNIVPQNGEDTPQPKLRTKPSRSTGGAQTLSQVFRDEANVMHDYQQKIDPITGAAAHSASMHSSPDPAAESRKSGGIISEQMQITMQGRYGGPGKGSAA